MARPVNPRNESELQDFLRHCVKTDLPKFRKRLVEIAMGTVMDTQLDSKTSQVVQKPVAFSVSVDAINCYGKNIMAKVVADVKGDQKTTVEFSLTDSLKEVEARKRAEYEKKAEKELRAKEAGILAKKVIGE